VNRYFDTPSLTKSLEKLLLDIPTAIIQILAGLILLAFYHPVFIAFGVLLIFIVIIIIRFTSPQGLATSVKASDYKYAIAGWLEEMARVIKSFKYGKKTDFHIRKTDYLVSHYLDSRTDHFKILLTQFWSFITFKIIITAAMLTVGVVLLLDTSINVGQFIAADIVIIAIIASVEKLISSLDKVYDTLTSIQKLNKVLDSEIEHNGSLDLPSSEKGVKIDFNNVSFSYPNGEQILKDTNFVIESGKVINLVGKSGSGKSTILRLLTGTYKSYEGGILIDEVPIGNYNLTSLRNQTGVLLYQQDIFNGTLLQNITLGVKDFSTAQISELAEIFSLKDFIKGNKEGLDVVLDPLGKRLPSNIRQDVLLMRALLGKHRLLLLEHPFDHLTVEEKSNLCKYLNNQKNSTIIITSEQPETQMHFDERYVLENGTINKLI
jgi:ABC-type bacteriocin/lantibiotic exporter with double-glycine peptidase domain